MHVIVCISVLYCNSKQSYVFFGAQLAAHFFIMRVILMSQEFGDRLRYFRTHKTKYSQKQVADMLGVERSTYTKYESGATEPSITVLRKLKQIYNVSYDELLHSDADQLYYEYLLTNGFSDAELTDTKTMSDFFSVFLRVAGSPALLKEINKMLKEYDGA